MRIEISREEVLLDTGGGLKKARMVFSGRAEAKSRFLLHNVDVISTIDFGEMAKAHKENGATVDSGGAGAGNVAVSAVRRAG